MYDSLDIAISIMEHKIQRTFSSILGDQLANTLLEDSLGQNFGFPKIVVLSNKSGRLKHA
jgi:hypothetical protein